MKTVALILIGLGLGVAAGILVDSLITAHANESNSDGDATRERCVQDCAAWAKRTTDELRAFCAEPDRKCQSLQERTDPSKFRPLYRPGNTARHASCMCSDGQARISSIWASEEVW
jgi:hypothetical protein